LGQNLENFQYFNERKCFEGIKNLKAISQYFQANKTAESQFQQKKLSEVLLESSFLC
jgi:hypothetical protein